MSFSTMSKSNRSVSHHTAPEKGKGPGLRGRSPPGAKRELHDGSNHSSSNQSGIPRANRRGLRKTNIMQRQKTGQDDCSTTSGGGRHQTGSTNQVMRGLRKNRNTNQAASVKNMNENEPDIALEEGAGQQNDPSVKESLELQNVSRTQNFECTDEYEAAEMGGVIVSAFRVSIRQAEVVDMKKEIKTEIDRVQRKNLGIGCIVLIGIGIIITTVVVLVAGKRPNEPRPITLPDLPPDVFATLQSVSNRGKLNCGLSKRDNNAQFHPEFEEMWKGFFGDFCRAIAAAIFDGDENVTIHEVGESERWEALQNGTIDVLAVGTPSVSESLHFNVDRSVPATFSMPFLFDGVGVGGIPYYINGCATTKGFKNFMDCEDVRVCIPQGSEAMEVFQNILHPSQIVEATSPEQVYTQFANGCCNMLATDWSNERAEVVIRNHTGYKGAYSLGEALYSKQPYALATRKAQSAKRTDDEDVGSEDDPQVWSEFVDWVLQSLIAADQYNISQSTSSQITETEVFGDKYRNAFKYAVGSVGNYGEIYQRNMGHVVPQDGMNLVADGSTGLHYHRSIGDVTDFGSLDEDGTLAAIKKRGKLLCGVPVLRNENFALGGGEDVERWSYDLDVAAGIDMEYCRALASSIFQGLSNANADSASCGTSSNTEANGPDARVEFVFLEEVVDGYTELRKGQLDVISGYRFTLQGDVKEPATRKGYTYSQPFLYGPVSKEEHVTFNNRCMVTRQQDQQWSDFVQIVVMSLFYAEEHHIDQAHANSMPSVNLFGPTYKRMMKDSIFAVGNYGEVYGRFVEPDLPRAGGPNQLNAEADPQLCSFPGPIV